jgi:putative glutamine amidotransferase
MDERSLILRHGYAEAVAGSGGMPVIIPPANDNPEAVAGLIDGLLLSGGNDLLPSYYGEEVLHTACVKPVAKERSDFEFALLKAVLKLGKPILAICYGMQLLNVAFGGTLYQDIESQVMTTLDHRTGEHGIKIIQSGAVDMPTLECNYIVNSHHHQAVRRLGDELDAFAVSDDGIVEGIYKKGYTFVLGTQWHPERGLSDGISEGIFRAFINKCSK